MNSWRHHFRGQHGVGGAFHRGGALVEGGGGHALTAGAHGEGGCWEGLAAVGGDNGWGPYFHGPQLLDLPLKPPVLLGQ